MFEVATNRVRHGKILAALLVGLAMILSVSPSASAKDKKLKVKVGADSIPKQKNILEGMDMSKIMWPNPPAITRIKYLNYWSGEKFVAPKDQGKKKKQGWMDRVSGVATGETPDTHPRWQLIAPNGLAVDSKGKVYIADSKVRAIFIVDTETGEYTMIRNGYEANFKWPTGLAVDDGDTLFSADSGMKRVLVFNAQHKVEATITEGLYDPGGLAIDNENRLLYVTDAELDLVMVYDADAPHKLLRKIGRPGTKHTSTAPGEFSKPTAVAVDKDGNVYVSDTWNNRIEVFDADGNFIRTFGKAGDGPGFFARPKGIGIDSDGHVWVADSVQDRVQIFNPDGHLLIYYGGHGLYPGQFQSLTALAIDKNNRVMTTELMPGRMQMFRYIPNADAVAEMKRREAEGLKKKQERANKPAEASAPKAAEPNAAETKTGQETAKP